MTATVQRPSGVPRPVSGQRTPEVGPGAIWTIGAPRLLAGLDRYDVLDHAAHTAVHGWAARVEFDRLLALLDESGIAGRGGAGFPLATKLRALRGRRPSVVVNGTESEPASLKDRTLLRRSPHLVLDGALAVASAVDAARVTVAVHDELTAHGVRSAIAQRTDAKVVQVRVVPGGFVSGEARAVVRALSGGPALPTGRRTPPTEQGVLVSNAETFAQLRTLLRLGARSFADTGTRDEPGTTLLTVGGAVRRPGVVEVPLGVPLGIVLGAAGAQRPEFVVIGGYHGGWHHPVPEIELSRAGMTRAGGTLGAGVLLVLDDATCPLGELSAVATWLAAQSARQCGPCRFGLPALAADVATLRRGDARAAEVAFRHARAVHGRGACAHPDGTSRFVTSALHVLQDDIHRHVHSHTCGRPVLGRLPIGGVA